MNKNGQTNMGFMGLEQIQSRQLARSLPSDDGDRRYWERFKKPNTQKQSVNFDGIDVRKKQTKKKHIDKTFCGTISIFEYGQHY